MPETKISKPYSSAANSEAIAPVCVGFNSATKDMLFALRLSDANKRMCGQRGKDSFAFAIAI